MWYWRGNFPFGYRFIHTLCRVFALGPGFRFSLSISRTTAYNAESNVVRAQEPGYPDRWFFLCRQMGQACHIPTPAAPRGEISHFGLCDGKFRVGIFSKRLVEVLSTLP
jgi:hypothetical protein